MEPKPAHLGLQYAEQFKDSSIVEVYSYRPPYPKETIGLLLTLIVDQPRAILDVGCGTGDICFSSEKQIQTFLKRDQSKPTFPVSLKLVQKPVTLSLPSRFII